LRPGHVRYNRRGGEASPTGARRDTVAARAGRRPAIRTPDASSSAIERAQLLLEHSRDIILILGADGAIVEANAAAVAAYGYPRDELLQLTISDLRAPATRGTIADDIRHARAVGATFETVHVRKDGSLMPVEASWRAVRTGAGDDLILNIVRDISDRKAIERQLREAELLYRTVVERIPAATYVAELATGKVLYVSPQVKAMLGFEPRDLLTSAEEWINRIHPDDRKRTWDTWVEAQRAGKGFEIEYRVLAADGSLRWVENDVSIVPDAAGRPQLLQGIAFDITARKLEEEAAQLLGEVSAVLSSSLDHVHSLQGLARLLVPVLGDWCVIEAGRAPQFQRVALEHRAVTELDRLARRLEDLGEASNVFELVPGALEATAPVLLNGADEPAIRRAVEGRPGLAAILDSVRMGQALVLPLRARGEAVGAITLALLPGRRFSDRDLGLLEQIGKRAAIAIDNALLHRAAREAESRYRSLVEQMPAVTFIQQLDDSRTMTYVSPQLKQLFGLSAEQYLNTGYRVARIHPDDFSRAVETWDRTRSTGEPFQLEYRLLDGYGRYRWVQSVAAPVPGEDGRPAYLQGVMLDISARKEAEDRLVAETETLRIINAAGKALSAELDLDRLVGLLTDAATLVTGAQFGAFFHNREDEHGERYTLYTLSGAPREAFEGFPMPRNTGVFGPTFRGERVVRSADITQEPEFGKNPPYFGMPKGHLPVRSYLAAPVVSRSGSVIGGLFLGHHEAGVFSERHEELLAALAAEAAIALDNANLVARVREAEARYRTLVECIPAVTYTARLDDQYTATYVSPQLEDLFGYSPAEWLEAGEWLRCVHPDDRGRVLRELDTEIRAGRPVAVEYRMIAKGGEERWVRDEAVLLGTDGGSRSVLGVMLDITAEKRAEMSQRLLAEMGAALASSLDYEQTLGAALQLAVPAVADWAFVDVIEHGVARRVAVAHANPAHAGLAERVKRYPPRPGWKTPHITVMERQRSMVVEDFSDEMIAAIASDPGHEATIREVGPRSMIVAPLVARGRTLGALTFITSESGRRLTAGDRWLAEEIGRRAGLAVENSMLHRQSEEARHQLQERWLAMPEAAIVFLPDDTASLSARAAEMLHLSASRPYSLEELPILRASGLPWAARWPENPLVQVRATGRPLHALEFQVRTPAGTEPIVANVGPLDLGEAGSAAIMLFQPIRQLRLLDDTKTDFMRVLAHELRHPLATASLALDLLEGSGLPGETAHYLATAQREISSMDRLVGQLTDIVGAGQDLLAIEAEALDLGQMLEEERMSFEAAAPNHHVHLEIAPGPVPVSVDRRRIVSVISNLVANAARHASAGTVIRISAEKGGDTAVVAVADEGPGIAPEVRKRIFEKYYRGDSHGSMGLGLYLARRILEYHDGEIWYDDELPGFRFKLPARLLQPEASRNRPIGQ
jgi:PAS domain S-box-containing protein